MNFGNNIPRLRFFGIHLKFAYVLKFPLIDGKIQKQIYNQLHQISRVIYLSSSIPLSSMLSERFRILFSWLKLFILWTRVETTIQVSTSMEPNIGQTFLISSAWPHMQKMLEVENPH